MTRSVPLTDGLEPAGCWADGRFFLAMRRILASRASNGDPAVHPDVGHGSNRTPTRLRMEQS